MIKLLGNFLQIAFVVYLTGTLCSAMDFNYGPQTSREQTLGLVMGHIKTCLHLSNVMIDNLFSSGVSINSRRKLLQHYRKYQPGSNVPLGFNSKMLPLPSIDHIWRYYVWYQTNSMTAHVNTLAGYLAGLCYIIAQENKKFCEDREHYVDLNYEHHIQTLTHGNISILLKTLFSTVQKNGLTPSILAYRKELIEFWQAQKMMQKNCIALVSFIANLKVHVISHQNRNLPVLLLGLPLKNLGGIIQEYPLPSILSSCLCLEHVSTTMRKKLERQQVQPAVNIEGVLGAIYAYEITRKPGKQVNKATPTCF